MRKKQVVGMLLAMFMSIALLPAEAWAAKGNNRQDGTDGNKVSELDCGGEFNIPDIIDKG